MKAMCWAGIANPGFRYSLQFGLVGHGVDYLATAWRMSSISCASASRL
jgi:hypothetical protein